MSFFDRWQLKTMPLIKMERYMLQQRIEIVQIRYKKSLWAMRLIFTLEATLISRIVAFGAWKTQKWLLKSLSIRKGVSVWYSFSSERIIGPYFFEDEAGAADSVNGLRYRTMINAFLWPEYQYINDIAFHY